MSPVIVRADNPTKCFMMAFPFMGHPHYHVGALKGKGGVWSIAVRCLPRNLK